ncbi:MAG: glycerol-3-phosphate dehydrogenase C-terminal domain-containing protein, partial [Burkholderiaceae bacterium]
HAVVVDAPNATRGLPMVCLVGGKWTTFRSLSEQASDAVLQLLGRARRASTERLPIGGGAELPADSHAMERFVESIASSSGVSLTRAAGLVGRYGSNARALGERFGAVGDVPLEHAPEYSVGELHWLCRATGVVHLDDLVIRRTLLAIRGQVTDPLLAEIADVAAAALGWSPTERDAELRACDATLRDRHSVRLGAAAFDAEMPKHASSAAYQPTTAPLPT